MILLCICWNAAITINDSTNTNLSTIFTYQQQCFFKFQF